MSKYNGQTKKKREERDAKKQSGVGGMIASIAGQTQKFINEWSEKHNSLAKLLDSVFKIATTEVGKLWANQQGMADSIDHIDLNVLAIAELQKALYVRLCQHLPHTAGTVEEMEAQALELCKTDTKEAFEVVLERRRKDNEEKKAAAEKAQLEAKAAEEAKTEAERAEKALKEAESEVHSVTDVTSGGKGADIPDGAQVFGG